MVFKRNAVRHLAWRAPLSRDASIQADVRMFSDSFPGIIGLRLVDAPRGFKAYAVGLKTHALDLFSYDIDGSPGHQMPRRLQSWPLPRAYGTNEWARLELRASGDELTASVDGRVVGTVHDAAQSEPGGVLIFGSSAAFRNIIYVPLDAPGGADSALTKKEKDTTPADDAAWKKSVNLLSLIDPQKDVVSGQWTQEGTSWISDATGSFKGGAALLQLPYQAPEEYDYRISFTRLAGDGSIMQLVSRAGKNFGWVLRAERMFMGFERAGNKRSWAENPSAVRVPNALPVGSRHISLVQVRKNGLTAYLDGQLLVRWPTDYTDFMGAPNQLRDPSLLGLGSWQNPVIFHSAEIREVTGQGVFTRPPPPATAVSGTSGKQP